MAADDRFVRRTTTPSGGGGAHLSDSTAWCAWAHRGHRLWAAMPPAFWLYVYKVQRCPEMSSHDWKACPYAHIGERARRRDPRQFPYLAAPCPEYLASRRRHLLAWTGAAPSCARGLRCHHAHGSFELWLHPARFRTRICERGVGCPRPICFFAHFPAELRGEEDTGPLVGLEPPPPPRILSAPSSLSFLSRDDLITQAMPRELHLYVGAGNPSLFVSPAAIAVTTAAPVPALLQALPDDENPAAGRSGGCASEDGSVTSDDDYAHLDLIVDMVNHLELS